MRINKHDTNGTKPLLGKGELGYDDYTAGGDTGRVYVGTGSVNIPQAKKAEVVAVDGKVDTHTARADNPHSVTKTQVGLGNVQNADTTNASNITSGTLANARLANSGVTAGTYKSVTVDGKGIVTGGTNPTTLGGYGITDAYTKAEVDTTTSQVIPRVTSTDNAIVRFDGSTGNVQNSSVIIDDSGNICIGTSGKIIFNKASGGLLNVTATDGATSTDLVLPLSGTVATTADVANAIALGGRDVYLGSYGLTWNETTRVYTRIGAENYTAIQSKMKRCVLNADGSVNYYLSATDSNYKADGTAADLTGASGNVMVEIPKFYIRYGYTTTGGGGSDTVHSWEISQTPDTGFVEHWAFTRGTSVAKRYYPAYQGYSTGSKLISRSGVYPTVAQTLGQFRTLSKANSITNPSTGQTVNGYWSNIDFALYEAITLLMIIEYGTMDIQSALGKGRTMLSGGSWVGGELIGVTGLSNTFGNRTANYTYTGVSTDAAADLSFMSYRGCENFFGNVWRMTDGVIFLGTTNNKSMWFSTNPSEFNDTASGYTQVAGVSTASTSGYGRRVASTDKGFIITDVTGGTSGNGTTDYYYTSTTNATVALVGGDSADGLYAGPLDLDVAYSAASLSNASVGCGVSF